MKAPVSTAIAIGVGLVVLLGYFIQVPLLTNLREILVGMGYDPGGSCLVCRCS